MTRLLIACILALTVMSVFQQCVIYRLTKISETNTNLGKQTCELLESFLKEKQ